MPNTKTKTKKDNAQKTTPAASVIRVFNSKAANGKSPQYRGEADISGSLIIKAGNLFMLLDQRGDANVLNNEAEGLYFHDCRFLSKSTLKLGEQTLTPLLTSDAQDEVAEFELVNPAVVLVEAPGVSPNQPKIRPGQPGSDQPTAQPEKIPAQSIGVSRKVRLGEKMTQSLIVKNYNHAPLHIDLKLAFDSDFLDIFTIRGTPGMERGTFEAPKADKQNLILAYHGRDKHLRTTTIHFEPAPAQIDVKSGEVLYRLEIAPHESWEGEVSISLEDRPEETTGKEENANKAKAAEGPGNLEKSPTPSPFAGQNRKSEGLYGRQARLLPLAQEEPGDSGKRKGRQPTIIESQNQLFNRVLQRCFDDLLMLLTRQGNDIFFAAGVPWFVTLFGRDSLITALQTLIYNPDIAAGTLQLLASYQGTEVNDWKDEQPGKILHELRVGERANLGEIPFTPYYGTVDATPLFLILMGEYLRWTGDYDLFKKLLDNVKAALNWIDRFGNRQGECFLEYASQGSALSNQGWKDSGNSIVNSDGSLADPPIALVEVQGYVYKAKKLLAPAFRAIEDGFTAKKLELEAEQLWQKFNDKFWMPNKKYYALALQEGGRQADAIASNPGQALWGGIVPPEKAALVCERLMKPDMFNGWGIRTLSSEEKAYNPYDYQVGSVWPHDNSIIAAGLKQYGFVNEAIRIMTGLFQTATYLPDYRLPEVFAGVERAIEPFPVKYPVACRPQAWAAGSLPFMLTSLLGLEPDLPSNTLRIIQPALPEWLPGLVIRNLAVAGSSLSLEFTRTDTSTEVRVLERTGDVNIEVVY